MWDLPRPGRKPVSPVLAGRFLTTVPPEKPKIVQFSLENKGWIYINGLFSFQALIGLLFIDVIWKNVEEKDLFIWN